MAAPDPIEWGVDEVVSFLCNPESAPWALSANAPRPDPVALETALRENYIVGEVLLHSVDRDAIKNDLGVKALGHRSMVMKAIEWLRLRSPKYQMFIKTGSLLDDKPSHEAASSGHQSSGPASLDPIASDAANPFQQGPPPATTNGKRRVVPTLISGPRDQNVSPGTAQFSGDQAPLSATRVSTHGLLPPGANTNNTGNEVPSISESERSQQPTLPAITGEYSVEDEYPKAPFTQEEEILSAAKHDAFYEKLLQKYPPIEGNADILPEYGDSGSEGSYDSETWDEIISENPELGPKKPDPKAGYLPFEEAESIVSQYIAQQEERWKKERLPKELPHARPMWRMSREQGSLENDKRRVSDSLKNLESRLNKLKRTILEVHYKSRTSVQKACDGMKITISQICKARWELSILKLDLCPPAVSPPPTVPRPRRRRSNSVKSAGSEKSEDLALSSDSDPVHEDDLTDFIVEDSDDESLQGESEQSSAEAARDMPFTLASSPQNDDSEQLAPARKRRRLLGSEDGHDIDAGPGVSLGPRQADAGIEVIDLTGTKAGSAVDQDSHKGTLPSSPAQTSALNEPKLEDDMEIETPPLNPISSLVPQDADVDNDMPLETPPLNPVSETRVAPSGPLSPVFTLDSLSNPQSPTADAPDSNAAIADPDDVELFHTVSNMSFKTIEAGKNRIQMLAKSVMRLLEDELKDYPSFLDEYLDDIYRDLAQEALRAMLNNGRQLEGRDSNESMLAMRMGALFVSWYHCITLQPTGIHKRMTEEALVAIEEDDGNMFSAFLQKLKGLISAINVWKSRHPSRQPSGLDPSSGKKREEFQQRLRLMLKPQGQNVKKRKSGSRVLSTQQKDAQERFAKQEKAREALRREREEKGLSNSDPAGQAVTFKEPIVYLDPHIGQFAKPHQLMGIQFMWRELIEAKKSQGCLLAHVMGLGKTFQVISLLVTIAAAAASDDPKIREQIPRKFLRSQTLVLCPPPLVENWSDEFDLWTPENHHLGPIRMIYPRARPDDFSERIQLIKTWNEEGGILIMSYEMLRILIQNKSTRPGRNLNEEEHELVQEWLLSGPNIIVADEAHKLRNDKSAISQVASRFKSMSRIAMTGSPLANHLSEYYQMVEWVAPGYLESFATFKTKFMDPIQAGSYMDSTIAQQRKSLVALKLLNGILNPKIHRADTSAIASDLPSKYEFILCVPLTDLQKQAYDVFVECLTASRDGDAAAGLWSWLALLQLCCNHPFPFREKLADRSKQSDDSETGESESQSVLPKSIKDAGLPSDLLPRIEAIFSSIPNLRDPSLSHRSMLLDQILDQSMEAGDKVLVFSQSIPTMNYLDDLLRLRGRRYRRIDGSMAGTDRQAISKEFNAKNDIKVLLISTRAGGIGLNMFGANRVAIFDFLFNPTWEEQAVGRAYRLGQTKPVFVYRFIAGGTFEENIFNKAVYKSQLAVRVVDKKNVVREGAKNTPQYLFPVRPVEKEDHSAIQGKDPRVLDKILAGDSGEIILRASLSHIQDNENDRLTDDERRRVDDELTMERLKRSDPAAYEAEQDRRRQVELKRQYEVENQHRISQLNHQRAMREWREHQEKVQQYREQWQRRQAMNQDQQHVDTTSQQYVAARLQHMNSPHGSPAICLPSPNAYPSGPAVAPVREWQYAPSTMTMLQRSHPEAPLSPLAYSPSSVSMQQPYRLILPSHPVALDNRPVAGVFTASLPSPTAHPGVHPAGGASAPSVASPPAAPIDFKSMGVPQGPSPPNAHLIGPGSHPAVQPAGGVSDPSSPIPTAAAPPDTSSQGEPMAISESESYSPPTSFAQGL